MPNSFKQLVGLVIEATRQGHSVFVDFILKFFFFKLGKSGWFYLTPSRQNSFCMLTKSKNMNLQQEYFFCQSDKVAHFVWKHDKVGGQGTKVDFGHIMDRLDQLGIVNMDYTEAELVSARLSPYSSTTSSKPVEGEASFCNLYNFDLKYILTASVILQWSSERWTRRPSRRGREPQLLVKGRRLVHRQNARRRWGNLP